MAKQNTENGQRMEGEEGERAEEGYPGEQQTTYALWEGANEAALWSFHVSYVQKFWMQSLNLQGIILSDKQRGRRRREERQATGI